MRQYSCLSFFSNTSESERARMREQECVRMSERKCEEEKDRKRWVGEKKECKLFY